jgi:hypothetical protein
MVDLVVDIIPIVTIVTVMLMPNYVMPFKKVNVIVDQVADSVMVIQVLEEGPFQIIVLVQEVLVEMVFVLLFNVVNVKEVTVANSHMNQKVEDHTVVEVEMEIDLVLPSNVVNVKEAMVAGSHMKLEMQLPTTLVVHTIKY